MHAATFASFRTLSPQRIGGWSAALALHGFAFALLVMPPRALLPEARAEPTANPVLVEVRQPREPLPVPPPPKPPEFVRTAPVRTPQPVVAPTIVENAAWSEPVEVQVAPGPELADPAPVMSTQGAQIAYDHAPPPPYPRQAHVRGWEGDVLLRVRVGADGRPRAVEVERSSGRRVLDQSAAKHVLRAWRFQPALQGGTPVEAWALVPISFRIERG